MGIPPLVLMAPPPLSVAVAEQAPTDKPLDVREPPFGEFDFDWMNGNNTQPQSLLGMGPVTWSLYVDTYYAWQFRRPIDHTIFPTTTAPLHDEISLNLAHIGVDVTGIDGPTGRVNGCGNETIYTDPHGLVNGFQAVARCWKRPAKAERTLRKTTIQSTVTTRAKGRPLGSINV